MLSTMALLGLSKGRTATGHDMSLESLHLISWVLRCKDVRWSIVFSSSSTFTSLLVRASDGRILWVNTAVGTSTRACTQLRILLSEVLSDHLKVFTLLLVSSQFGANVLSPIVVVRLLDERATAPTRSLRSEAGLTTQFGIISTRLLLSLSNLLIEMLSCKWRSCLATLAIPCWRSCLIATAKAILERWCALGQSAVQRLAVCFFWVLLIIVILIGVVRGSLVGCLLLIEARFYLIIWSGMLWVGRSVWGSQASSHRWTWWLWLSGIVGQTIAVWDVCDPTHGIAAAWNVFVLKRLIGVALLVVIRFVGRWSNLVGSYLIIAASNVRCRRAICCWSECIFLGICSLRHIRSILVLFLVFLHLWSVHIISRWFWRWDLVFRDSILVDGILARVVFSAAHQVLVFHRLKIVLGLVEWVSSIATTWSLFHILIFLVRSWHTGAWVFIVSFSWNMLVSKSTSRLVTVTTTLTQLFFGILMLWSKRLKARLVCHPTLS